MTNKEAYSYLDRVVLEGGTHKLYHPYVTDSKVFIFAENRDILELLEHRILIALCSYKGRLSRTEVVWLLEVTNTSVDLFEKALGKKIRTIDNNILCGNFAADEKEDQLIRKMSLNALNSLYTYELDLILPEYEDTLVFKPLKRFIFKFDQEDFTWTHHNKEESKK